MKNVILSADGDWVVYSVPSEVADNLEQYCIGFCVKWLSTSPHADKYRMCGGFCYNQADFIDYLNKWVFPQQQSKPIENLGRIGSGDTLPDKYQGCPQFNF